MNSVLDSLFLRRPRIDYVSPPICEVLFSSTGFPTIFLEPFQHHLAPSGPVAGGRGNRFFNWPRYVGEICHNLYVAQDPNNPNSPYNLLSECIPPNVIALCESGEYQISVTTADGEGPLSSPVMVAGGGYTFVPLPQTPGTICYNLYKTGLGKIWSCFQGGSFQICHEGCYRVSAITDDGETQLGNPFCVGPCTDSACPPGQIIIDPDTCACGPCPELPCDPGFIWDPATCQCVFNPVIPCLDNYIDVLADTFGLINSNNGYVFDSTNAFGAYFYHNRVISAPYLSPAFAQASSMGRYVAGQNFGDGSLYWFDAQALDLRNLGHSGETIGFGACDLDGRFCFQSDSGGAVHVVSYDPSSSSETTLVSPGSAVNEIITANGHNYVLVTGTVNDGGLNTHLQLYRYLNGLWDLVQSETPFTNDLVVGFDMNASGSVLFRFTPDGGSPTLYISHVGGALETIYTGTNFSPSAVNNLTRSINDNGWAIFRSTVGGSGFIWKPGTGVVAIPSLGGATDMQPTIITPSNVVYGNTLSLGKAWFWTESRGVVDLNTYIPTGSDWTNISNVNGWLADDIVVINGTKNGVSNTYGVLKLCLTA